MEISIQTNQEKHHVQSEVVNDAKNMFSILICR